ncbi:WecB/TagA/CpsF family glycosyltransferase [Exiguobacterium aestuarii]|uniref:WecB/TagA/CpsF family glycosyltransferase n=1 Tax=Exiguobacterium aestuarii TaxID=273527 RepID=A0ABW2PHT8_9BACL|nr:MULTISPECIES: WecB/TagA/CpsF family glycosyltransferase [Exiguobacterium]MCT4786979.1 WecB/TagA/CpsF family glycosyltransferase [Exiguobacterium aestuarii]
MNFHESRVLDYTFLDASLDSWLQVMKRKLHDGEKAFIITANPEIVMQAERDPAYKRIVQKTKYLVPDGVGIQWASKRFHQPIRHVIPGIELTEQLLQEADQHGYRLLSYGAKPEVQERFYEVIRKRYPNIQWVGHIHGYIQDDEKQELMERCVKERPDLVLVGLGMPLQEQWIASVIDQVDKGIYIGVGGTFDVLSGQVKRAPKVFRVMKLEWVFRIMTHARGKKKLMDIGQFIFRVLKASK